MTDLTRVIEHPRDREDETVSAGERPPRREWLVTNGLGGFASGTLAGVMTRRYHGLLIAALPAPLGRMVMFNHLLERVRLPDKRVIWLGDEDEVAGPNAADRHEHLEEFRQELGLPIWVYRVDDVRIEKRLLMPYGQNTVHLTYRILDAPGEVRLTLRPSVQFRPLEAAVDEASAKGYTLSASSRRYELSAGDDLPVLRIMLHGRRAALTLDEKGLQSVPYKMEESRGYQWLGSLWSPGYFRSDAKKGDEITLVASTEAWDTLTALSPQEAADAELDRRRKLIAISGIPHDDSFGEELILAADQFVVRPAGRVEEFGESPGFGRRSPHRDRRLPLVHRLGPRHDDQPRRADPGDAALPRSRLHPAHLCATTSATGSSPTCFPKGTVKACTTPPMRRCGSSTPSIGIPHITGDEDTLRRLLPTFIDIVEHHLRGTRFGIHIDPADGLFTQGADGYQLTWMDAKVGDWVVTPRRGKAVELNALWFNALTLLQTWTGKYGGGESLDIAGHLARARESFNRRFWYADGGYLYDVVDGEHGDDPSCRPNQILAISLPHPVLDQSKWAAVVEVVRDRLLTPVGLRSLAPGDKDYKPRYYGDLRARDAAYHQGTVWAWLIGPFIDAWRKVHPDDHEAISRLLSGFEHHLSEACVGSISEIFDAESPFLPRGCIAQAWSVAEVLRCWRQRAGS